MPGIIISTTGSTSATSVNLFTAALIGPYQLQDLIAPWNTLCLPNGWQNISDAPNRNNCNNTTYKHAEGDLHNLWLAVSNINFSRSNHLFGEIPQGQGESRFSFCPLYVRTYSPNDIVIEPRASVKGNIARSLFYMNDEYGFDLRGMLPMLKEWNRLDPPNEHEHWRNERIFALQGTRNKFIDNYHIGNSL